MTEPIYAHLRRVYATTQDLLQSGGEEAAREFWAGADLPPGAVDVLIEQAKRDVDWIALAKQDEAGDA